MWFIAASGVIYSHKPAFKSKSKPFCLPPRKSFSAAPWLFLHSDNTNNKRWVGNSGQVNHFRSNFATSTWSSCDGSKLTRDGSVTFHSFFIQIIARWRTGSIITTRSRAVTPRSDRLPAWSHMYVLHFEQPACWNQEPSKVPLGTHDFGVNDSFLCRAARNPLHEIIHCSPARTLGQDAFSHYCCSKWMLNQCHFWEWLYAATDEAVERFFSTRFLFESH